MSCDYQKYHCQFNDNNLYRKKLYEGNDEHGCRGRLIVWSDIAHYLIKKFVEEPWKNDKNAMEYCDLEFWIVELLDSTWRLLYDDKDRMKEYRVRILSVHLNVSPVVIYSDPNLPF